MSLHVLELSPIIESGEEELHRTYDVCRWPGVSDPDAWLDRNGASVRAVVTGGHLGITNEMMQRLPSLGIVAIAGVGFDRVDLDMARKRGVRVTNTPNVLTEDVADFALGLMVATLRRIQRGDDYIRNGRWPDGEMALARKVSGRRYGIIGLGRIGQAIAKRLQGFGGSIAYTDVKRQDAPYTFYPSLVELADNSDILIVAAAGGTTTRDLVGRDVLAALGPSGYLINVARGTIVDQGALIEALEQGRLAGAGLDVFADEPNVPDALLKHPNVTVTPHIASATVEAREQMARLMLDNLAAFFAGRPLPTPVV